MTLFWIIAGLLAAVMLLFGGLKVVKSRDELQENMWWVEDYTDAQVRLLGIAEVVGAFGVIVPAATGILPILSPIAAACLGVLMLGAIGVHFRRKDPAPSMVMTSVLFGLSAYVAGTGFIG